MAAASEILLDVRKRGDKAVVAAAKKFDGSRITAETMRVTNQEVDQAHQLVDDAFKDAALEAHKRIRLFAEKGLRENWNMPTPSWG